MRRNLRRGRSASAGLRELVLDLLAPWTRGVEIRLGEAADLGLPAGAAINLIAQADQPARQLGSIEGRGVRLRRIELPRLERAGFTGGPLRHVKNNDVGMELRGGVPVNRPRAVMLKRGRDPAARRLGRMR